MLTYITENKDKILLAKNGLDPLGITFQTIELDLIEIQSESIEEIARHKAIQAFEIIKEPLFVTDHGWSIPSLHGFPGPYMKYINRWFDPQDFLSLMSRHKDKTIINTDTLCYIDKHHVQIFTTQHKGRFISQVQGEGFSSNRVVTMTNDGKSVAEHVQAGNNPFGDNGFWKQFGKWYKSVQH